MTQTQCQKSPCRIRRPNAEETDTALKDVRIENPEVKKITLNSSPYGKPFYHRVGFVDTDIEKTMDGIRFTSMEYVLIR